MIKTHVTALIIACSATTAFGQAFGIERGKAIDDLSVNSDMGNGLFTVSVPSPHPEFEDYVVKAVPEIGVCLVRGIGKNHTNDRYGASVRSAFADLKDALDQRYGDSEVIDHLKSGALWDEENEWVMSIHQNERYFQAAWDEESGSDLPSGLDEILMVVKTTSSDTAWIGLQYRFDNEQDCSDVIAQESQSGL
ncbi:MAG: hypothetical protein ACE369_15050 [Roseovarius sp.]